MSEFYPFAPRESQLEKYREDARRSFSRIGWACFAMMLVMQGGAALLMLGCQLLAMRGSRFMIAFIQSEWFQWVITDAANYGLGLPVLLLILRPMPLPPAPPRRRVTAKQFGALALISYAVVYLTNLIGLGINAAISALRGQQAGEPLQDMVTGTNPWIIFLFGVLLAPVVEEWIFRKLILRRLAPWGEPVAIFGSAFLFGLFHGNFGQFFYAFAVGAVFAYVALRTGGIRYTVALHFLVNLLGMTVAQAVEDSLVLSAIYGYLILAITVARWVRDPVAAPQKNPSAGRDESHPGTGETGAVPGQQRDDCDDGAERYPDAVCGIFSLKRGENGR